MQHPDEGTIHAWLDGALSDEESKAIESHVIECGECAAAVAEARGLIAASSRIVSALDVVPGGVIPAARPRRAAWYTNTQLRAAAAIIVVAGASLLVMRNGRHEAVMQQSRPMIAAAPAATSAVADEKPAEAERAAAQTVAPLSPKTERIASKAEAGSRRENSNKQVAADQISPAVPPPSPTAVIAIETGASAARAAEPQRALFGKVSGVAVIAADSPELRPVRADTTADLHRTVYKVSSGIEVTLIELDQPRPMSTSASAKTAEDRVAQRIAAPPVANAPRDVARGVAVNSISWVSKLGRVMTLSGSLSKEELQALRLRLPADKQ